MDGLTFVIELLRVLAWPVVTALLVLWFRKPIRTVLDTLGSLTLRKLKAGGFEAEFIRKELDEAQEQLRQLPPAPEEPLPELDNDENDSPQVEELEESIDKDLLQHAPAGVIIAAWVMLENAIDNAGRLFTVSPVAEGRHKSFVGKLDLLVKEGLIPPQLRGTIVPLYQLRNEVVHRSGFADRLSAQQVQEFVETANAVSHYIHKMMEDSRAHPVGQILARLKVKEANEVQVAPMSEIGTSHSIEAARKMAQAKRGKYIAHAGPISMMLDRIEAARLVREGAVYRKHEREIE